MHLCFLVVLFALAISLSVCLFDLSCFVCGSKYHLTRPAMQDAEIIGVASMLAPVWISALALGFALSVTFEACN